MVIGMEAWVAVMVGLAATVEDLAWRTVSNWTCLAALAGGLACQVWRQGWQGLLWGALGAIAGFLVFLVFYLLGGMGGGDVKLMAGFGALLGAGGLLEAALWTAACGGVMAVVAIGVGALCGRRDPASRRPKAIPYAPAIAAGVWLTLISRS